MDKYDIVIVGGGTAGCAAAYTAAKLGLKTLLLEKESFLGGSMTGGLVVPAMKSSENQINTDFFDNLVIEMKNLGGQITYENNKGWFNPELLKFALDKMLLSVGVDILFNINIFNVEHHADSFTLSIHNELLSAHTETIYTDNNFGEYDTLFVSIDTTYLVDTTGNCELGKILNCNFLENENETQPFSLRFIMSGINLKVFGDWLLNTDNNRQVTTVYNIDGQTHLSTACTWDTGCKWALLPYFEKGVEDGILKPSDINYFQVFSVPGMSDSLAFNCPRLVENNGNLDIESTSKALIDGRSAILRLSKFCKKYFVGFENAYISNIANQLGIRTSRRIKGKYIYTMDDILSGKKFNNPVAVANYPIDVHSKDKDGSVLKKVQDYQIPVEALISADYKNFFVAGRCISADYMAQGAIRVQPTCFSMGEGLAKYIASLTASN